MGFYFFKEVVTIDANSEVEQSGTQINFLVGTGSQGQAFNPATAPRATFDFVIGGGLTLGGALGYMSRSGEVKTTVEGVSVTVDDATYSAVLFNPRVGYMIRTSPMLSIWIKGGLSVYQFKVEEPEIEGDPGFEQTFTGTQLTIDPALVLTPVDHVGILISPVIDQALTGNWELSSDGVSTEENYRWSNYGVSAGLAGFF